MDSPRRREPRGYPRLGRVEFIRSKLGNEARVIVTAHAAIAVARIRVCESAANPTD
ncbi:MAG TPA: hypothetical protein VFW03_20925 [Gemmatimonadaceae bacterium]|nr:hypothetical protein [Gemmatimonadaceae bacterium]